MIDTDSDPDFADIPIPGNDDAMKSIEVVISNLCAAVMEGKTAFQQKQTAKGEGKSEGKETQRRSSRAQFSASADAPTEGEAVAATPPAGE